MKHRANRRRMSNKKFIAILSVFVMLALTMVVGCAVDGTVAWLVSESESSVSTFTLGDINIKLTGESESQPLKIIPGVEITRSLKVTVEPNSEACWLFVKVEETNWSHFPDANGTAKVSYSVAGGTSGWTPLSSYPGVYYREVRAEDAKTGVEYDVNGVVAVSKELTKAEVNSIASGTQPQLSFTAYAVQRYSFEDAAKAWEAANPAPANP
ncbi:MAG TPA: hypothetical protein DE176_02055 [Clostridiales bacterium]|nr:hypothetical protein [Clostridiales bacterium]